MLQLWWILVLLLNKVKFADRTTGSDCRYVLVVCILLYTLVFSTGSKNCSITMYSVYMQYWDKKKVGNGSSFMSHAVFHQLTETETEMVK